MKLIHRVTLRLSIILLPVLLLWAAAFYIAMTDEINDETEVDITNMALYKEETSLRGIFVRKMLERIEAAPPEEQQTFKNALKIGLRSFSKGVCQNDN